MRASAFFAPDGTYQESGRDPIVGREAIVAHFVKFFRDGPPWRFEIDTIVGEGEETAVFYHFDIMKNTQWVKREGCARVLIENNLVRLWREYQ